MPLFKKRQDNITLIADNVCAFYMILKDHFAKQYKTEQIMFAAGIMDIYIYMEKGILSPNEVARSIFHAKKGEISLKGKKIVHARKEEGEDMSAYSPDETELLVNFIMQLECEIMSAGGKAPGGATLLSINQKKDVIRDTVDKALAEGKNHKFYAPLEKQALDWFVEKNMTKVISKLVIDR